jgi:hypothetical protein
MSIGASNKKSPRRLGMGLSYPNTITFKGLLSRLYASLCRLLADPH